MKTAAVPSILVAVVLLALGVIAEAQQPAKIRESVFYHRVAFQGVMRHSNKVYAILATLWKKTLPSNER